MNKNILILGEGGREHALQCKLEQSSGVESIETLPAATNFFSIAELAMDLDAFVIVGQDKFLADGVVDYMTGLGIPIFGPTKEAAKLESSKTWAAAAAREWGIPAPFGETFMDPFSARKYLRQRGYENIVIKPDGLAPREGVVIPNSKREADKAVDDNLVERRFGRASELIVIQDRLYGEELSAFALCDGTKALMLPSIRDYKRLRDGDQGPNTGGMGAFGPVYSDPDFVKALEQDFMRPTVEGMAAKGIPYRGILYAGLMLTKIGPKLIEWNVRFGDPEAQPQMLLLDEDLYPRLWQAAHGELTDKPIKTRSGYAVSVALASKGYPNEPEGGYESQEIFGLDNIPEGFYVFHAGTKREGDRILTAGGRVLHIASYGETLELAREKVYAVIGKQAIWFANMQYRKTIANM